MDGGSLCAFFVKQSKLGRLKHSKFDHPGTVRSPRGDLVVQGDVPVAKFRVSNSVKKFSNLLPLRVAKIDMISSQRLNCS